MRNRIRRFAPTLTSLATAFTEQGPSELVIPETFDGLADADVRALFDAAAAEFDTLNAEDGTRTAEQIAALAALADGLEFINAELSARDAAAADREAEALAIVERVAALRTNDEPVAPADGEDAPAEDEEEAPANDSEDDNAGDTIVASAAPRRELRVPLSNLNRAPQTPAVSHEAQASPIFSSGEGTGFAVGASMSIDDLGKAVDRKLNGYNSGAFKSAKAAGRVMREQHSIATFRREFPTELTIDSTDRAHVDSVFRRAADESRLPQGGLVASGGWCAPSETLYDLLELEGRDGLLSLPEVGVNRGGIKFTPGPDFASLYAQFPGFHFTEEDDIEGKYQPGVSGNEEGPKPCVKVECPDFEEERLEATGLCIQAGLLMAKGYPEVISRTIRGALVAHEHRVNGLQIAKIVAGSTAVNMAANQAGALAPVLDAIEKQVEHVRYTHRLPRNSSLEAIFPFWLRGAIRADLSRRIGVDLLDVTDQRIDGWFRSRGVNPQWVYNWQALEGTAAGSFTAWPSTVKFTIYPAGTWVKGASDIITLDTLYDSTLLGDNDYTALFTEEGWLIAKMGHDSRVVTVSICADGATHAGIGIECDGSASAAAVVPGSSAEAPLFTSDVSAG